MNRRIINMTINAQGKKPLAFGLSMLGAALLAVTTVTALLPLSAQAHRTWLLPSATQLESKEPWITVDAAVSENLFDFDTNAIKLDGLSVTGPDGLAVQPENPATGHLRSTFDLKLAKPGTYKISLATESVMASYKVNGETKRWRGTVEALAKEVPANAEGLQTTRMYSRLETFVTTEKANDAAFKTSNVGLEMVPITHPNELEVGQKASFRFLLDGKPAANLVLSVVPGGVRYRGVLKEIRATTDANGEFSVVWPEAGMYWIGANWPARAPEGQQAALSSPSAPPARRVSYSATVEVLPQ
jgi:uncharacterized GH25 family protein